MSQHGFARQMPWVATQPAPNKSVLSLESNAATLQNYPWSFQATLTYLLSGACLRTTLCIRNTSAAVMPFALGFHPYFRVTDKRQASIRTQAKRAYNNVSKQREAFAGFDLTAAEVDIHLLDHHSDVAGLRLASGEYIAVRGSSDFGIWVVWTLAGKDFVCLEPWTAPGNALNTGERLIGLAPGATHESWMEIAYARTVSAA
jgi:galactose mutarotase-like enzyme